ncbi:MAG: hemerythrin domain-containing protein [Methylotenera sp.]|nr:hemerythrin domain-containing protein [Oligoflexia bacterium]
MEAVEVLKIDQKHICEFLNRLEATGDASEKREIVKDLHSELHDYLRVKETLFYPQFSGFSEMSNCVDQAFRDHLVIRELAKKVDETLDSEETVDLINELTDQIRRHMTFQEQDFFPKARRMLGMIKMHQLGEFLIEAKEWNYSHRQKGSQPIAA